ncbi:6-phosphogluconolactonase [Pseudonocardia sp. HH130630-07]|uniref:6-phosphogluconolactonase n=1 Tax=Pseudonocardia sp. HH130630-07 TaxID=1690815 RepID=UPI0008153EAB|nr:6-phosphogluconolactonase [Pseudonocardia sp. HH130630-07]ANY07122.1 hypothetical protein AFB00_13430 [Pseudonocardia sp. HH130630-07]
MTSTLTVADSAIAVRVEPTAPAAGRAAGRAAAELLRRLLAGQELVRVAFAAAPSQDACLAELRAAEGIDWSRVVAFQLDDYVGLPQGGPGTFAAYLRRHVLDAVSPGTVHYMDVADGAAEAAEAGRRAYAELLSAAPLDLVLLGIGENGHLAFNDPPLADRHDPQAARLVELDHASRVQQVNDGCFAGVDDVPTRALTLTLPTLLDGRHLVCTVPGPRKRAAVTRALLGPVDAGSPASYLREHPAVELFLDRESAPVVPAGEGATR